MNQQDVELQIVFKDCIKFRKKVLAAGEGGAKEVGVEVYSSLPYTTRRPKIPQTPVLKRRM